MHTNAFWPGRKRRQLPNKASVKHLIAPEVSRAGLGHFQTKARLAIRLEAIASRLHCLAVPCLFCLPFRSPSDEEGDVRWGREWQCMFPTWVNGENGRK